MKYKHFHNFSEEKYSFNNKTLPPSPLWNLDMNPSYMPDGYTSQEKNLYFEKNIKYLIKPKLFNGKTLLEEKVYKKREKIRYQML